MTAQPAGGGSAGGTVGGGSAGGTAGGANAGGTATNGRAGPPAGPTLVVTGWRPPRDWNERLRIVPAAPSRLAGAVAAAPGGRAHLLAVGWASQAAVALAAQDPGCVRSLVLVDTGAAGHAVAGVAAAGPESGGRQVSGRPPGAIPHVTRLAADLWDGAGRLRAAVARHVADAEAAVAHLAPIQISDPDPRWPAWFSAEADVLRAALGARAAAIEHLGSTAVPQLAAKPVIDVFVGADDLDACVGPVRDLGYSYWADEGEPDHRFLLRCADGSRLFHVHVVSSGGRRWRAAVAFRDALRTDPALARRYAALKRRLAAAHHGDREAYTAAKTDFVRQVIGG